MTKEKQRGFELQTYIDSIRDMTIKEIAIQYLKKHHLPKFLASMLAKFSAPLLIAKDYELADLENKIRFMGEQIDNLKAIVKYDQLTEAKKYIGFLLGVVHIKNTYNKEIEEEIAKAEAFLNSEVEK